MLVLFVCRSYCSAVEAIEGAIHSISSNFCFQLESSGTFGSRSFHLIDPIMLCSAAYAELGDGDGALHRLQAALSIAELVYACLRSMVRALALTGAIVQVRR